MKPTVSPRRVRIRFFRGRYVTKDQSPTILVQTTPPSSLVKSGSGPWFYPGDGIRLDKWGLILRNCRKGVLPVFSMGKLYQRSRVVEHNYYTKLLQKLYRARIPLLFQDQSPLIQNRLYHRHLAMTMGVPQHQLQDHLSGSIQYLLALDCRDPESWHRQSIQPLLYRMGVVG